MEFSKTNTNGYPRPNIITNMRMQQPGMQQMQNPKWYTPQFPQFQIPYPGMAAITEFNVKSLDKDIKNTIDMLEKIEPRSRLLSLYIMGSKDDKTYISKFRMLFDEFKNKSKQKLRYTTEGKHKQQNYTKGTDGKGTDGKGTDGKGTDGKGREKKGKKGTKRKGKNGNNRSSRSSRKKIRQKPQKKPEYYNVTDYLEKLNPNKDYKDYNKYGFYVKKNTMVPRVASIKLLGGLTGWEKYKEDGSGSLIPDIHKKDTQKILAKEFYLSGNFSLFMKEEPGYNGTNNVHHIMKRDETNFFSMLGRRKEERWFEVPKKYMHNKSVDSKYLKLIQDSDPSTPKYKIIKDMTVNILEPIHIPRCESFYKYKYGTKKLPNVTHMAYITINNKLKLHKIWKPLADTPKIYIFTVHGINYLNGLDNFIYADSNFIKNLSTTPIRHKANFITFLKNFAYMALTGQPVSVKKKNNGKNGTNRSGKKMEMNSILDISTTSSNFIEFLKNFAYMALTGLDPPSKVVRQSSSSNFIEFLKNFAYMALTGVALTGAVQSYSTLTLSTTLEGFLSSVISGVNVSNTSNVGSSKFIEFLKNFAYMALTGLELEPSQSHMVVSQGPASFESLFNISGYNIMELKKKKLSNTSTELDIVKAWLENQISKL